MNQFHGKKVPIFPIRLLSKGRTLLFKNADFSIKNKNLPSENEKKIREIDSFHFTSFLAWTFFKIFWPTVVKAITGIFLKSNQV